MIARDPSVEPPQRALWMHCQKIRSCGLIFKRCLLQLQVIKRAVRNVYEMGLEDFIFGHPAQIALLGIQFQWTADTQAALVAAKSDKTIMTKNMKKTDALLK